MMALKVIQIKTQYVKRKKKKKKIYGMFIVIWPDSL